MVNSLRSLGLYPLCAVVWLVQADLLGVADTPAGVPLFQKSGVPPWKGAPGRGYPCKRVRNCSSTPASAQKPLTTPYQKEYHDYGILYKHCTKQGKERYLYSHRLSRRSAKTTSPPSRKSPPSGRRYERIPIKRPKASRWSSAGPGPLHHDGRTTGLCGEGDVPLLEGKISGRGVFGPPARGHPPETFTVPTDGRMAC